MWHASENIKTINPESCQDRSECEHPDISDISVAFVVHACTDALRSCMIRPACLEWQKSDGNVLRHGDSTI